jgi:hypothetical protein
MSAFTLTTNIGLSDLGNRPESNSGYDHKAAEKYNDGAEYG